MVYSYYGVMRKSKSLVNLETVQRHQDFSSANLPHDGGVIGPTSGSTKGIPDGNSRRKSGPAATERDRQGHGGKKHEAHSGFSFLHQMISPYLNFHLNL